MILAVNACPRNNGVSYTETTLAQVLANGGMPSIVTVVWDDVAREGSAKACHELIKLCFRDHAGEDVLLLEDDVNCCKNALLACERYEAPPGTELVSFYNNRTRFTEKYGAVDVDYMDSIDPRYTKYLPPIAGTYIENVNDDFCYAQALRLSAKLVEFIASHQWPKNLYFTPESAKYITPYQIRDRCLGHLASLISPYVAYVVPNWFEHVGDVTAVVQPGMEVAHRLTQVSAGNFINRDHDALGDDVSCIYHGLPRAG
jgi:hypothetical protein